MLRDADASGSPQFPFVLLLPFEIVAFVAVFWADANGYIPISKTPFLFAIAWVSLRMRGIGWGQVGLRLPANWKQLLGVGCVAGVGFWLFEYFIENPALHFLTGRYPDLSEFKEIVGNVPMLLILLAANIVLAGFGEEMVWRGYALPRIATVLDEPIGWAISLVVVNLAFGLAHVYQGEAGATQAAVQGVLLGLLYLWSGKNLIAPICAHIVANTCDFLLMFAGLHVGLTGRFPF